MLFKDTFLKRLTYHYQCQTLLSNHVALQQKPNMKYYSIVS